MQLIDTHVHINFETFQEDLEAVQKNWQDSGVVHLVHSCVEPQEFGQIKAIADKLQGISLSVGLHPLEAHKWTETTAEEILKLAASDSRVVAIGETGLDYYKASNLEQQKKALVAQLEIAKKLDKAVIIHCRDAAAPLLEVLREFWLKQGGVRGVMHCWGGTMEETQWFLELGMYISISGIVTFKNATEIKETVKKIPADRLLIETDCPYLAPVPKRGKRNEPAYVRHVAGYIAELRGVKLSELARTTTENACRLFGISLN